MQPPIKAVILCLLIPAMTFATADWARAEEEVYVVKKHDTLTDIAREHGVQPSELAKQNNLSDADFLVVGQRLVIPSPEPPYTDYVVKRGDSLSDIASQFGISVDAIIRYNQLTHPDRIYPGQTLQVPNSEAVPERYPLDAELKSALNKIQVASGRWEYIVIHHSGSPWDTPKSMDRYHRNTRHMENGLAYHFVIGNGKNTREGKIYIGDRWREQLQGGHLARLSLNEKSIGICLVGNFMRHEPSASQLKSLRNLVYYLMQECGLDKSAVKSHRDINPKPTACPGRHFPMSRVLAGLP